VIDFTSALYLGMEHASRSLPGWDRLTLGKPAALEAPAHAQQAETQLAELIGCERALLATSTLHLFWDLFSVLAQRNVNIFLDAGSYPIARWGVERAAASGTVVKSFRQHDPMALQEALDSADGKPPVIVADGYCPGCGRAAPVTEYLRLAAARGGCVVVDDSQALGIFGKPAPGAPYGSGGGGSMQRAGTSDGRLGSHGSMTNRLIVGASLAKAFGVPVAVLAGSVAMVDEFEGKSATRVHCSPPSAAVISAALRALAINRWRGDTLRMRLARQVLRFRRGLRRLGLLAIPGLFPVQPLRLPNHINAETLGEDLSRCGVEAVLNRGERGKNAHISFVLTARHRSLQIEQALGHLEDALAMGIRVEPRMESSLEFERS
jgi:8-amino-7-oxononanoate synthase